MVSKGDAVLIGNDLQKRIDWPLARVIELYPGKEGNLRVAMLRTVKGEYIRPIQRLYHLEKSSPMDSALLERPEEGSESSEGLSKTRKGKKTLKPISSVIQHPENAQKGDSPDCKNERVQSARRAPARLNL